MGALGTTSASPGERAVRALLRRIDATVEREAEDRRRARRAAPRQGVVTRPPEVAAGVRPEQLPRIRSLLGQPLTSPAISRLGAVWAAATNPGEVRRLTAGNSRATFDKQRRRFWTAVQDDPAARRLLTDAGFGFATDAAGRPVRGRAPYRVMADGRRMTVTVDHITERQSAPRRALDPANLRLSPRLENTVLLRQITERNRRYHGVRAPRTGGGPLPRVVPGRASSATMDG